MKFVYIVLIFGVSTVLADVAPYPPSGWKPQRALLILPPTTAPPPNATSPQPVQDEAENLEKVNDSVMERLRQETGSDTGVYYVYLPDGRLQRVQYTTAPIKQQEQTPDTSSYQQPSQYSQNFDQSKTSRPQGNQQSNNQFVVGTNKNSNQANQQQQYNRFPTQQFETKEQGYTQDQTDRQQQGPVNDDVGNPSNLLAQYNAQDKVQNLPASNYVASVRFTDIPPITGPVFAYSSSPLVRIVRYANNF